MINKANLEKLRSAYNENKLVPFIGAGLAIPFKIPSWGNLIKDIADTYIDDPLIPAVHNYVQKGDYWGAIKLIKDLGEASDLDIQTKIAESILPKINLQIDDKAHNYSDIAKMKFNNIFTTNYDFLITRYINNPLVIPQILHKVELNSQMFFDTNKNTKVWHLHGHISDIGSIVISKEKYDELYSNGKYKKIFDIFQANGVFLFLGFSMTDLYIQMILEENKKYFNSQHFIVLDNPSTDFKKKLKEDYNINVIEYDSSKKSHSESIREILNYISNNEESDNYKEELEKKNDINKNLMENESTIKAPCREEKDKITENLFFRKLMIEDIDDISCDISRDCFIMAELATRQLRKKGFSENVINDILAISYMEYQDIRYKTYRKEKNSQSFLDTVHSVLEEYDFTSHTKMELNKFHKRGFIHILADDTSRDIWWGENKIDV